MCGFYMCSVYMYMCVLVHAQKGIVHKVHKEGGVGGGQAGKGKGREREAWWGESEMSFLEFLASPVLYQPSQCRKTLTLSWAESHDNPLPSTRSSLPTRVVLSFLQHLKQVYSFPVLPPLENRRHTGLSTPLNLPFENTAGRALALHAANRIPGIRSTEPG